MTEETVSLALAGDVMLGRGIDQLLPASGDPTLHERYITDARRYLDLVERTAGSLPDTPDFDYIWGDVPADLRGADVDVSIMNLETSITRSDDAWPGKGIHYRMSPDNAPVLDRVGWDICCVANNHVLDWGYQGLEETLETLSAHDPEPTGAGMNRRSASRPARCSLSGADGREVAVFGLAAADAGVPTEWRAGAEQPGVMMVDDLSAESAVAVTDWIDEATSTTDIVVLSIHWGPNWGFDIPSPHRSFAHHVIESGVVDLVHGHSSHHVKGLEVHAGHLIIFGCGDLLADYEGIEGHESYRGEIGGVYVPQLDAQTGELVDLRIRPTVVERCRLNRADRESREWLRDTLTTYSPGLEFVEAADNWLALR